MKPFDFTFRAFWPVLLAACAAPPMEPSVPSTLVPVGEQRVDRVAATGVQIYQCRATPGKPAAEWVFVAPEAQLLDTQGQAAGKHYAGPHWEALDGSKIVGSLKAREDAPQAGAIPWLLLSTRSVGGAGRFAKVTGVQRINTSGGVAPSQACDSNRLGATERVPYTADYVMYSPRAAGAY